MHNSREPTRREGGMHRGGKAQLVLCLFGLESGRGKAINHINIHLLTLCPKQMVEYCVSSMTFYMLAILANLKDLNWKIKYQFGFIDFWKIFKALSYQHEDVADCITCSVD